MENKSDIRVKWLEGQWYFIAQDVVEFFIGNSTEAWKDFLSENTGVDLKTVDGTDLIIYENLMKLTKYLQTYKGAAIEKGKMTEFEMNLRALINMPPIKKEK
jgi:hypothetical protein